MNNINDDDWDRLSRSSSDADESANCLGDPEDHSDQQRSDDDIDPLFEIDETHEISGPPTVKDFHDDGTRKRKYQYIKRVKRDRQEKARQKQWLFTLETMTESKLRRFKCCNKFRCFETVDYEHFLEKSRHILSSNVISRRTILQSLRGANDTYFFNGKQVCTRFLKKSFRFSTTLMASSNVTGEHDNSLSHHISAQTLTSQSNSSTPLHIRPSPQKDSVVSFLLRLSEDCGDKMPDKDELHLPFNQKREVYALFLDDFKQLYQNDPPTPQYFMFTWKRNCPQIKVRKTSRFAICDTCEELDSAIKSAVLNGRSTKELKVRKKGHLKMVADERMEYQKKRDRSRLNSSNYCSLIVDGADQSAFGLPHFTTKVKSTKGHSLKVKLIGALEHTVKNQLHLFTMTQDHETGSNHIVETIHRFLNERQKQGPLPPTFLYKWIIVPERTRTTISWHIWSS